MPAGRIVTSPNAARVIRHRINPLGNPAGDTEGAKTMFNARNEVITHDVNSDDPVEKLRNGPAREGQPPQHRYWCRGFKDLEAFLSDIEFQLPAYKATMEAYSSRPRRPSDSEAPIIGNALGDVYRQLAELRPVLRQAVDATECCHWQ